MRWLAVTNKNPCPSSPRAAGRHQHLHQTVPTTTAATGDIITSWGAGTGQCWVSVSRCLGVSLHLIEIQECVGRRVEEVPTCHTGPLPLTTPVIQSAHTVSDIVIVILSTRWTAASHQSCGRVWTEDLHLVLTLVTLMHAARRCITPVTWTRPPVTFTVPSIRNRWRLRAVLSISRPSPAGGVRGG